MFDLIRTASMKVGEPHLSYYSPAEIEEVARGAGFDTIEHHRPSSSPHFVNRRDGLMPPEVELLVVAAVSGRD